MRYPDTKPRKVELEFRGTSIIHLLYLVHTHGASLAYTGLTGRWTRVKGYLRHLDCHPEFQCLRSPPVPVYVLGGQITLRTRTLRFSRELDGPRVPSSLLLLYFHVHRRCPDP